MYSVVKQVGKLVWEWLIWWVNEINKMEAIMWIAMLFQLTVIEAINE